jgi:hypothetical protein
MKSLVLLLLSFLFLSCTESSDLEDLDIEWNLAKNIPISSNVQHAYSYVILAEDFSTDNEEVLQFDSSSFIFSLTVVGYQAGTMELSVYNEDSTASFSRVVTSSTVISEFPEFQPRYLHLALDDFTGQATLSLTDD